MAAECCRKHPEAAYSGTWLGEGSSVVQTARSWLNSFGNKRRWIIVGYCHVLRHTGEVRQGIFLLWTKPESGLSG